ncbi:hypothetical protein L6Q79_11065 [bacterium]|nr:hypothetical protein [bacterium]NUN46224.1 hypothetical protein [bacterium]
MKMFSLLLTLVFLLLNCKVIAQSQTIEQGAMVDLINPRSLDHPIYLSFKDGDYLTSIIECDKWDSVYRGTNSEDAFMEQEAYYNSFVGNYKKALNNFDKINAKWIKQLDTTNFLDRSFLSAKKLDAVNEIIREAQNRQITIVNEAHHVPQHRAFISSLLKPLYESGYRYFATEMLTDNIDTVKKNGYVSFQQNGFYPNEPVYANLIRKAIEIGYTLVGYEDTVNCDFDPVNPFRCLNQREQNQAKNIANLILKNNSNAKILIHCGYQHADEVEHQSPKVKTMAAHLKELSNTDPLTIDQTVMSEHSLVNFENSYYRYVQDSLKINSPAIFKTINGYWVDDTKRGFVDMQVFHPRTNYINGRPNWLIKENYILTLPDFDISSFPFLVQAFKKSDKTNAIPMDQFLVDSRKEKIAVAVPKGYYRIRMINSKGTIHEFEVKNP